MKKMLIMCGAGHAKVNDWLEENGFKNEVEIKQSAVSQEVDNIRNGVYDIVISTTIVPDEIKNKVINGVALLTGIGTEQVWSQVKAALES